MNPVRGSSLSLVAVLVVLLSICALIPAGARAGSPMKRGRDDVDDYAESDGHEAADKKLVQLPRVLDFKEYAIKFHKVYSATEWMAKANLFLARVINIFKHNAKFLQKNYDYFLGLNAFTDISGKEYEAMGIKEDPAMRPVLETDSFPANMPATELPSVQHLTGRMGFSSMAATGDADEKLSAAEYEARHGGPTWVRTKESLVDFAKDDSTTEDGADVGIREFYREFKKSIKQQEDAERMSRVIDLNKRLETGGGDGDGDKEKEEPHEQNDPKSERAMRRHKIKYSPVVSSNNKNYDATNMMSHGLYDNSQSARAFSEKMAGFLAFDGIDFMEDLEVYEPPTKRTRNKPSSDDDPSSTRKPGIFSSFFSSAKEMAKSVATTLLADDVVWMGGEYMGGDSWTDAGDTDNDEKKGTKQNEATAAAANTKKIKYSVDWRVTGCITRPKSQDACNACYAFTVVALMEYYYCRQMSELTEFSAQYIVDCGRRTELNGCKGGRLASVGKFISQYGLELQSMYPYSGVDGQCPYQADDASQKMGYLRPKILNWVYVKTMAEWYEYVRKGPLLVGIGMPSDFLAYGGGVHDGLDCNPEKAHAMLLVGSGSQDGKEFWLFKNSFSSDWGENGYFRLAKDAPLKCFHSGVVVRVTFNQGKAK